jgi:hypothetical protein
MATKRVKKGKKLQRSKKLEAQKPLTKGISFNPYQITRKTDPAGLPLNVPSK